MLAARPRHIAIERSATKDQISASLPTRGKESLVVAFQTAAPPQRRLTTVCAEALSAGSTGNSNKRRRSATVTRGEGFSASETPLVPMEAIKRRQLPAGAQQFVVPAGFGRLATFSTTRDAVGMGDGVQAMRDDKRGSPAAQPAIGIMAVPFRTRVERRGSASSRQDDWRILDERARDGDPLAFAARKLEGRVRRRACRSPPEGATMKSCACAAFAAEMISAVLASGMPNAMFSRIVPRNRYTSWPT